MMKTLKMRLEPTAVQKEELERYIEAMRYLYNAVITACKLTYKNTGVLPTKFEVFNLCTRFRNNVPFLGDLHSMAVQYTATAALQACEACLGANKKKRRSKKKDGEADTPDEEIGASHFPRYKRKGKLNTYAFLSPRYFSLVYEENENGEMKRRLKLRKIEGTIKTYNQDTPLDGKPKMVRITRENMGTYCNYYATISYEPVFRGECEIGVTRTVGIDIGLSNIAALSDGTIYPNDHIYSKNERLIKKRNKQLIDALNKNDIPKQKKRINQINHLFRRICNVRRNTIETISRDIVNRFDLICMENLSVQQLKSASMNKGMTKSYDDASLGRLRQRIYDKAESAGRLVVEVDPRGTSQICSSCGETVRKELSDRRHRCPFCGLDIDRDVNAAINIRSRGSTREPSRAYNRENSPARNPV